MEHPARGAAGEGGSVALTKPLARASRVHGIAAGHETPPRRQETMLTGESKNSPLPPFAAPSAQRSRNMAAIGSRDTKPELFVRRQLHASGYRFRLHRRDLPGKPDIVLPRFRVAVFVHGCFWHGHDCPNKHVPKSNSQYWSAKIARNRERDSRNIAALEAERWRVVVVWECCLEKDTRRLIDVLDQAKALDASTPESMS